MRRLIEHVVALSGDALATLTIQDVALCQIWIANGGPRHEHVEGCEVVPDRVRQWLACADAAQRLSQGRRSQTLLRDLIDQVEDDHVDTMARDELDLLEAVYALSHACENPDAFQRVRRLIAPRRARIAARRRTLPDVAGLPSLSKRLLVVRAEDISAAPAREVKVLAGVELPGRGPVLVHAGHVRVLGDVPESTTLVVEDADCVVDGFVLGRVAASGNCEVLENISGVVISRNGDIRARNLVEGAFAVAKRGWVHCQRIHGARIVFAGTELRVREAVARSRLMAPSICIGGAVVSGEIQASQQIHANRFGMDDGPLDIMLRAGLSCKDYGENPGRAMRADVSRALHHRARLNCIQERLTLAIRDAEGAAETGLMYLLASHDAGRVAEAVVSARRRLDVLARILLGLRTLYAQAEAASESAEGEDASAGAHDGGDAIDQIEAEINSLLQDMPGDVTLRSPYAELKDSRKRVKLGGRNRMLLRSSIEEITQKLERWRRESDELSAAILRGQQKLASRIRIQEVIGADTAHHSKVLALQRLLARAKSENRGVPLRDRSESAFMSLMTRTIEKRLTEAKRLNKEVETHRDEFNIARQKVLNEYQMQLPEESGAEHRITVEGVFDAGIRIFADPRYVADFGNELPEEATLTVGASHGQPARYVCVGGHVCEEKIAEHSESSEPATVAIA